MLSILTTFGRLGGIVALLFLIVALLRQLITLVGILLMVVKLAIIVAFAAVLILIVLAIFRDRARRKREASEL